MFVEAIATLFERNPARGETCRLNFYRLRNVEPIVCTDSTPTGLGPLSLFALQAFHPYGVLLVLLPAQELI
jgi:hypothetical protein